MARARKASTGAPAGTPEQPGLFFADAAEFGAWLAEHHDTEAELWMVLRKRHVADRGLTWQDAVVEALRWGWIDSRGERIDDDTRRLRWSPRRPGSIWSAVNVATAERLIGEGRMQPSGLAAYGRRREDRTAVYSFEQPGEVALTPEHEATLRADPVASAFWDAAPPGYRTQCSHWVESAKQPATRDRRLAQLVADCAAGELVKYQRYGQPPGWLARARTAANEAARKAAAGETAL